ncbi:MAG: hypothetical protein KDA69_04615 [Planctomycetaceae bacterium]|nr:hypothetical protein [Planctomycetaceae bacterium]
MRVFVAFLIGLTSTVGLAAEGKGTSMSVTKTGKQQVILSGHSDASHEVVLRIAKSKHTKQLEWTSQIEGEFTAQLTATTNIPLGEGKVGKGLEFKVQHPSGTGSTSYITMTDADPIPQGTIRFRPQKSDSATQPTIERNGNTVIIADIICEDGTTIPVSILIRKR